MTKRLNQETELTIAVCVSTYYKLNGGLPSYIELCSMLGDDMAPAITEYMIGQGFWKAQVLSA
ncbi:MAG: hypothetical protein VZR02_02560 [Lachnospiraceae bacterium]|nr:hypothetical protein [Lachnospiraceae bacterium]